MKGGERICTAVGGFAGLCLTTRPRRRWKNNRTHSMTDAGFHTVKVRTGVPSFRPRTCGFAPHYLKENV